MNQRISIAYVSDLVPLTRNLVAPGTADGIGDKYCTAHNMLVLENASDQITIALAKESLPCLDEIRKVLPREKTINARVVDRVEIHLLFNKIYDLFGTNHCR
jgi:hypothetical protein